MSFTDQKQRTATEADCKAKWGCGKPGERFRCFLCGHKFVPGDLWRWVYAGDLGFTNFMVCDNCDGDDVRERWRERMRFPIIPNEDFDKPCSVVRPWMNHLPFKMQTVMLVALRGFDGVGKHDGSKPLIKALRMTLLQNANPNSGFMEHMNLSLEQVFSFLEEESHSYPMHWLMHFAHAAEIIGYEHPQYGVRVWWSHVYHMVCDILHVTAESKTQMWERLADSV